MHAAKKFIMSKESMHSRNSEYIAIDGENKENIPSVRSPSAELRISMESKISKTEKRRADLPIFTNEYWMAMQHKEAGYIHFFLISPMNLISLFGSFFDLYFSRTGLLLTYLNAWMFLLGVINTYFYYYYTAKLCKEYGKEKTKSLVQLSLLLGHFLIFIVSVMNIVNMITITGVSEINIYGKKRSFRIESSSMEILPWMSYKAHSYTGVAIVYMLIGLSTAALSYTEIKCKFVTEKREISMDQIKYVAIKIAIIICCTTIPTIHSTFNFISAHGFTQKRCIDFSIYMGMAFFIYTLIGACLVGAIYGTTSPWQAVGPEEKKDKIIKKRCKKALFAISIICEVYIVYYTLKKLLWH